MPVASPRPADVRPVDVRPVEGDGVPAAVMERSENAAPLPRAEMNALISSAARKIAPPTRPEAAWSADARRIAAQVLAAIEPAPVYERVQQAMARLLSLPPLVNAAVSCCVLGADGTPLVAHRADVPTNPCSNAKLVTAAWALTVLGPMHRFRTAVARTADGAFAVQGGFDPTLTRADIASMVARVTAELKTQGRAGIPRLVLDASLLVGSNIPASFARYGDEDWEYLARPEPISVDKNVVRLVVTPGPTVGSPAFVHADTGAFSVRSRVVTVAAGSEFKVGCDELDAGGVLERDSVGRAIVDVWGTVALDFTKGKRLVMKSPAPLEQVAWAWCDAFSANGIGVERIDVGGPVEVVGLVSEHASKPLASILETSLATSNAFDHEMLALAAAHKEARGAVSLPEAAARLTAFLHGLGADGVLVNASGIGNESRVPAGAIARLLQRAVGDASLAPVLAPLLDGLARPGESGTLKGRMLYTPAEGCFRGKTGTGAGAVALSGVFNSLVMGVLVEDIKQRRDDVRAVLDAMAIVLATLDVP